MNKLILPVLGVGGIGAVGIGSYMFIPKNSEAITFRTRYKDAILNIKGTPDHSSLWDSKFTSLSGKTVKHPKLQLAVSQHSSDSAKAKELHKEACQDIYDSEVKGSKYQQDFKDYCSKNLKDELGGKWITEENSGSKWTTKLTNLKNHSDNSEELDDTLKSIKTSIAGDNNNTFDDTKRGNLKSWCVTAGTEVFISVQDSKFKLVKLYCSEP